MLGTGITLGLSAAVAQSLSYIFSRRFVIRHPNGVIRLLVIGHIQMGMLAVLLAVPALWGFSPPPLRTYLGPLVWCSLFYLLGQFALFAALRYSDASRTAPLLGLKIPILAVIATTLLSQHLGAFQWLAVGLSVAAAFILNYTGQRMHWQAALAVLFACFAYSISDLNIGALVRALGGLGVWQAPLLGVAMTYALCGAIALAVLPWSGRPAAGDWPHAAPFAASWFTGMILLYDCFGAIGVVYGNILQSTRGLISILIGVHLAGLGMTHLERRIPKAVLAKRLAAAALMSAAISLYALGAI